MMFMYFPWILWILGLKFGPNPLDHFDPVRITNSLKLPPKLAQIVESCPKTKPQTFGKCTFNTFVKN